MATLRVQMRAANCTRQWLYVCGTTRTSWLYLSSGLRGMTRNTSFSLVSLTHRGKGGAPQVLLRDFCRFRSCTGRWLTVKTRTSQAEKCTQTHVNTQCQYWEQKQNTKQQGRRQEKKKSNLHEFKKKSQRLLRGGQIFVLHSVCTSWQWNKNRASVLTVVSTLIVKAPLTQSNTHYVTVWCVL